MRDTLETAGLIILATVAGLSGVAVIAAIAIVAIAFRLLVLAVLTAPFWGVGLIALWVVGII